MTQFIEQIKTIILKCFLEECKYVVKEKKMPQYITDNIEICSNGSDEENSDKESSMKKIIINAHRNIFANLSSFHNAISLHVISKLIVSN